MRGNKSAFIADDLIFLILLIQLGVTTHSDLGSCRNPVTPPPPSLRYRITLSVVHTVCMWEWSGREREREGDKRGREEGLFGEMVCWCEDENGIDHFALPSLTLYYQAG